MQARQEQMEKSQQVFHMMKPYLEQELQNRLMSKSIIKVARPIRLIVERISKSATGGHCGFGQDIIPAGSELTYEGQELSQLYFSDQNGKEYAVHTGMQLDVGQPMAVNNSGYIGLLTSTDIFTSVKEQILTQN